MSSSLFPSFHKLSVQERVRTVRDRGLLSSQEYKALVNGETILDISNADTMIENVIGVMGLPIGLGLNFLINEKDYVVPLAVEEPSIVAALSFAAKTARATGGCVAAGLGESRRRSNWWTYRTRAKRDSFSSGARMRSSTSPTASTRGWWRAAAARSISR